jgi:hypothetical protein
MFNRLNVEREWPGVHYGERLQSCYRLDNEKQCTTSLNNAVRICEVVQVDMYSENLPKTCRNRYLNIATIHVVADLYLVYRSKVDTEIASLGAVRRIGCRMFQMVQLANQHNYCGVGSYYLVQVADQWYNKKSIYQAYYSLCKQTSEHVFGR